MKESRKPSEQPAKPAVQPTANTMLGAFEVVGTASGAGKGGQRPNRAAKPPVRKAARRPTFIEPLEGRTIIG